MKVKLGDVCEIQAGGTPSRAKAEYWQEGKIPWIKISDFKSKYLNEAQEFITEEGLKNSSAKLFDKGTVLYSIFATLGEVTILNIDAATNQAIAGLRITDNGLNRDYLYYYLLSQKNEVEKIGRGVAQNNINLKILRQFEFDLPCMREQIEISNKLNNIQNVIKKQKKQLEKLNLLVKARFIEMFGEISTAIKIGDVFITVSGGTPLKTHREYYENGNIPWLTSGEVAQGLIFDVKNRITELGLNNSSAKWLPKDTVVVAMYGATAGQVGLLRIKTTTNQAVCGILPDVGFNSIYLFHAVLQKKEWMILQSAGGAQPNISQSVIRRMEIPNPPIGLQNKFARFAEQAEKTKQKVKQSLEKTETLKKALMQKYFG